MGAEVRTRTVAVGELDLVVDEAGVGGRPLLLVHGFVCARSDFASTLEAVAPKGWHAVAPDLPGHGDSSHPPDEAAYSFDRYAEVVLGLADAVGFAQFVLVGHSMGGMIAQEVALAAPERVRALVLADTSHGSVFTPEVVAPFAQVARTEGIDAVAVALAEAGMGSSEAHERAAAADPDYAGRADRTIRASSPAMFAAMFTAIADRPDRLDALEGLTTPTLVTVGDEDTAFLDGSARLAQHMPAARLVVISGAGHAPHFEAPQAWLAALGEFLDELDG